MKHGFATLLSISAIARLYRTQGASLPRPAQEGSRSDQRPSCRCSHIARGAAALPTCTPGDPLTRERPISPPRPPSPRQVPTGGHARTPSGQEPWPDGQGCGSTKWLSLLQRRELHRCLPRSRRQCYSERHRTRHRAPPRLYLPDASLRRMVNRGVVLDAILSPH